MNELGRSGIRIDDVEHGFPGLLIPPPLDGLPLFFPGLELPIEIFNGGQRVIYPALDADPTCLSSFPTLKGFESV